MSTIPAFEKDEVELLVSSVEQTLKNLRTANEKLRRDDPELVEYGRRYAVILQKLLAISDGRGGK